MLIKFAKKEIQALPTHFSDTFPRKPIGTRSWFLIKDFQNYKGKVGLMKKNAVM